MDISEITDAVVNDIAEESPHDASPPVDAVIRVSADKNELAAYISIEPPLNGGAPPTLEALKKALSDKGITTNIDAERLERLAASPVYNSSVVIARGTAPIDGADGGFTLLFDADKQNAGFKEKEDGTIDFYNLDNIENVSKGQVLARITLPSEGSPGISVTGKTLVQKRGKPIPSILGKNTELSEDGTAVLAAKDGPVEFKGNRVHVNDVFSIEGDVDISTGHIKVASSLSVLGSVLPGYKVEAGENISIRGTVESAFIKAGGNVKLQSGITGSELHCDGDLTCRFIENCKITVKGDITAEYILNSSIKCGNNLKTIGEISKIIGGSCSVGGNIETRTIGSISNVKTKLELVTNTSLLERQAELKSKLLELEKTVDSLRQLVTVYNRMAISDMLPPEKKEVFEKAEYSYNVNTKLLNDTKKELNDIDDVISKTSGKIVCKGTIYPGTAIVMGTANLSVTETLNNTMFYSKDGCVHTSVAR